jgi:hypothetical protein
MRRRAWVLAMALAAGTPAAAQNAPGPPGPYVLDFRGTTVGLPSDPAFFPPVPSGAIVPARGFGFDAGGHVYFATWRAARLGVGASALYTRATAPDVIATVGVVAPQFSLNFGTADGWSYLSAGVGGARFNSRRVTTSTTTTGDTTSGNTSAGTDLDPDEVSLSVRAINVGGGARWFINRRLAVGFDIRFHMLAGGTTDPGGSPTPRTSLVAVSAGLSFR